MPRLPNPPDRASFWDQLSPKARSVLESQGVGTVPPPAPASTPPPGRALPFWSSSRPENRSVRRASAQLERKPEPRSDKYVTQLQRDNRRMNELRASIERRGGDLRGGGPIMLPVSLLVQSRSLTGDASGTAIRIRMRQCRNKVAVGAIRAAALVPQSDGTTRYTWADERARRIAALGFALLDLAVPTVRKGRWDAIVRGIPQGAFCMLLASPWEPSRRPSRSALVGRHWAGGRLQDGQVGYLRALHEAGFCYAQQLPAAQVEPFEKCWESGYSSNRYWIVSGAPSSPLSDAARHALIELHQAGLDAHRERLKRSRRGFGAMAPSDDVVTRAAAAMAAGGIPPPAD
jgi:hypothetical protein